MSFDKTTEFKEGCFIGNRIVNQLNTCKPSHALGNDFAFLESIGGEVAGAISLTPKRIEQSQLATKTQRNLSSEELALVVQQLESHPFLVDIFPK